MHKEAVGAKTRIFLMLCTKDGSEWLAQRASDASFFCLSRSMLSKFLGPVAGSVCCCHRRDACMHACTAPFTPHSAEMCPTFINCSRPICNRSTIVNYFGYLLSLSAQSLFEPFASHVKHVCGAPLQPCGLCFKGTISIASMV